MDQLPIRLSQASGVPFYRQIVDQMAELIRSGQLAPGTRLPSFRELAPQLLVSLITVRRAYSDLEHAGLIILRQGQGTFVAEDVKAASRDHALAEARRVLALALPEDDQPRTFVAEDVKAASRDHALAEARRVLALAMTRARQLGLTGAPLRAYVRGLLVREKGGSDARD